MVDNLVCDTLDAVLADAVEAGAAPGLVAVVADREGLIYEGAAGARDPCGSAAMTASTHFWFASCTKLVTSVAALQLVERGRLALDAPIDAALPDFAGYRVLAGFDNDGTPVLRPPARPITLRHLLTHTAGLGYPFMNAELIRAYGTAGPPPPSTRASLRVPLLFDPGEGWAYGTCTDWVGLAVEAAAGRPLDAYCRASIFAPLGMDDTAFAPPAGPRAGLCQRGPDGRFDPIPSPVDDRTAWDYISGGGGLSGTAADFVRLLQTLLRGGACRGTRILGEPMVRALFTIQTGAIRAGALASVMPALNAAFDLFPDMATGFSFGGLINPEPVPGGRHAGSLAWAGLANTYYWADPAGGLCAVLSAQHFPFADPAMLATLRAFEAAVYSGRS